MNGVDCITSERIAYDPVNGFAVNRPSTTQPVPRNLTFWRETYNAAPGSQWQTHDPTNGARVGLASGQPLFMSANNTYLPPGAGSSFYRQLCSFAGADYTLNVNLFAANNTDTLLSVFVRFVDNNNNIHLDYVPATTAWNLIETIAGVPNTLATGLFDLTTAGLPGDQFSIALAGTSITVSDTNTIINGTYTTAHTAAGQFAFLITATGANNSGFGGNGPADNQANH